MVLAVGPHLSEGMGNELVKESRGKGDGQRRLQNKREERGRKIRSEDQSTFLRRNGRQR